jgi:hypothetical protein
MERHFVSVLGFVGGYGCNLMFVRDAVTFLNPKNQFTGR